MLSCSYSPGRDISHALKDSTRSRLEITCIKDNCAERVWCTHHCIWRISKAARGTGDLSGIPGNVLYIMNEKNKRPSGSSVPIPY